MEPMIQVENLCKSFSTKNGTVEAARNISFSIEKGEIFGIIGLSGAGKSTLVRCLNLLERPTSGTVRVNGKNLTKLSEKELRKERQNIGMIFQHFNLLMQRTALDNVKQSTNTILLHWNMNFSSRWKIETLNEIHHPE